MSWSRAPISRRWISDITIGELMVIFEESGRSRMPVYSESLDDPRGMVHIRDLLSYVTKQARNKRRSGSRSTGSATPVTAEKPVRQPKPSFDLGRIDLSKTVEEAGIIRQVLFVPPSMHASDLMQRMQAARIQMALVIDEYGGTDGLASLEDIVEMVVGDIEDEHDDEEVMFAKTSDDVFVADARVELEEIAAAIGPDFDVREQLEDVDTLGGLVFASLGRIPARGEVVQAIPGFEFQVLDADPRRVKRVRIVRKRPPARRRPAKGEEDVPSRQRQPPHRTNHCAKPAKPRALNAKTAFRGTTSRRFLEHCPTLIRIDGHCACCVLRLWPGGGLRRLGEVNGVACGQDHAVVRSPPGPRRLRRRPVCRFCIAALRHFCSAVPVLSHSRLAD